MIIGQSQIKLLMAWIQMAEIVGESIGEKSRESLGGFNFRYYYWQPHLRYIHSIDIL